MTLRDFRTTAFVIVFDAGEPAGLACDFNGDGLCDATDIDALVAAISGNGDVGLFDLNGDGVLDAGDRDTWLSIAGNENIGADYLVADANLDGVVDISDFNIWNSNKFTSIAAWTAGDFNVDGVVDTSDFNIWNSNKFQSSDAVAVPEPTSQILLSICILLGVLLARRRG